MKEQKSKPSWRRFFTAFYGGVLVGLLILVFLAWQQKNQILELERKVDEVAAEWNETMREADRIIELLEAMKHETETSTGTQ